MAIKRYTKMEYKSPDEMVFGDAKYPVSYGLGQTAGGGWVIPEINFAPRPGAEKNPETLRREYVDYITKDILDRAVAVGMPAVQLENEHVFQMVNDPEKFEKPVVAGQKELMQKYHDEYGIMLSIRHTIADPRLAEEGLRPGMDHKHSYPEKTIEAFEVAAANGADLLSVETMGGKEVADYAILRQDIRGWLFAIGYLGSLDMEWIWPQIVEIARKNKIRAGGDTNCAGANTSMFMAGGYLDRDIARTWAATTRCIASARTLIAYEAGATGPDKDCGYEGPIEKAISGKPSAQEGKNCTCAHQDLMGNLIAQVCDLWSNESVEYHPEFGGSSVQCWLGSIGYEAALMNTAKQLKQDKILRDLYMATDRNRSPEGFCLAYDNAYKIGQAIVENGNDIYLRSRAAGMKAAELMQAANDNGQLKMSKHESDMLRKIIADLSALPTEQDKFVDQCMKDYKGVPMFNPKNYDL
jgi:methanol--5-hydroxybenzimidazolylcobamide Co-methyltransferase